MHIHPRVNIFANIFKSVTTVTSPNKPATEYAGGKPTCHYMSIHAQSVGSGMLIPSIGTIVCISDRGM